MSQNEMKLFVCVCVHSAVITVMLNGILSLHIVELDISTDSTPSKVPHLSVYKKFFETPFFEDTEHFYTTESAVFLDNNPVTEYMKKVSLRSSITTINWVIKM